MSTLSRRFTTCDEAALGGFKKILKNNQDWKNYEYGFLIVGWSHPIVRQLGHEAFDDTQVLYHYTMPYTDHEKTSISHTIPPQYTKLVRAFCHTHPTPGSFSTKDFRNFKKLRELKAAGTLAFNVSYYLMESNREVRRSDSEQNFREGTVIEGLDDATP
jgi:hypothetical protein